MSVPRSFRWLAIAAGLVPLVLAIAGELALRRYWPQQERAIGDASGPNLLVPDSELGWKLRPNGHVRALTPEFTVDYRTNAAGWRDETPHPSKKPAGTIRVLVVGDSFVFGAGNAYQDIWPVVLEHRLTQQRIDAEVIKAGISALDTRTELLLLNRLLPVYRPDLVVLAFLPNDLFTNTPLGTVPAEPAVRRLQVTSHAVLWLQRQLVRNDRLYTLLYALTPRRLYFAEPQDAAVAKQFAITRELLGLIAKTTIAFGIRLVVVSIPQDFQVIVLANGTRHRDIEVHGVDRRLASAIEDQGGHWFPMLDILAADYRTHREDLYFRIDGHLTPRGNHLIGRWVADHVVSTVFSDQLWGQAVNE